MVKVKLIVILLVGLLAMGAASTWFIFVQRGRAKEAARAFFHTEKLYPTSGGEKMRVEW